MSSICLISSDNNEIEQFKIAYPNGKIISDIDSYILPCIDEVNNILSTTDTCIIGETVNYSDDYILFVLRMCKEKNIKVFNYHISVTTSKMPLKRIKIPVIFICSLLPDMGKSQIGLKLIHALSEKKYTPLYISSNPMWEIYNHEVFPHKILRSDNPIYELNRYLTDRITRSNANIVVLCIPGGIISSNKYNPFCDYGLMNYIINQAVKPTYILNCIHQNTANIDAIPEPFNPNKINQHIRTEKILDQNEYDFYVKKRNISVTKDMFEHDEILNVFDSNVFNIIAADICNVINIKEAKQ